MTERIDSLFFLKLGFFVKSLHFTKNNPNFKNNLLKYFLYLQQIFDELLIDKT